MFGRSFATGQPLQDFEFNDHHKKEKNWPLDQLSKMPKTKQHEYFVRAGKRNAQRGGGQQVSNEIMEMHEFIEQVNTFK